MVVERYNADRHQAEWDAFVQASKNGTFLLTRGYMDYHADRFSDHSILVRDVEGRLTAVMPAHRDGKRIVSHGGLTYGGVVIGPEMLLPAYLRMFEEAADYLKREGFEAWEYKTIPHIYHRHPAEEDRYALFRLGARAIRRDILSVVPAGVRIPYQNRRVRGGRKALANRVTVQEETEFGEFWDVLSVTLAERFTATPVHTLAEITRLCAQFPANIRLFTARKTELLAGVVVYESDRVAHCQYIAASAAGRAAGALDLLFDHLQNVVFGTIPYFDFGSSHTNSGHGLNVGLIDQKEGFGARSVIAEHFEIDLTALVAGALSRALQK